MFILYNIGRYIDICFLPYVLWCLVGIVLFVYCRYFLRVGLKHEVTQSTDSVKYVITILFFMISWRLLFDLKSKRYFLPTVIPTLILAAFGIASLFHCIGKSDILKRFLCFLVSLFVIGTVFIFFYVGRQNDKLKAINSIAECIRSDYLQNSYRNAAIISNSREAGRFLHYSRINGNYSMIENVDNIQYVVDQKLFQYDVIYIVFQKNYKYRATLKDLNVRCFHSYEMIFFPGEIVNSKDQKVYTISKIISKSNPASEIRAGILRNGTFQISDSQTLDSSRLGAFPFFADNQKILFPRDWRINFNHKVGYNFSDWRFDYRLFENRYKFLFHTTESGVAIYNKQRVERGGDYYLKCQADLSRDASLSFFLYTYDDSSKFREVQSVGFLRPQENNRIDSTLFIRASDLPVSTSTFCIGFIPLGDSVELECVDLIPSSI